MRLPSAVALRQVVLASSFVAALAACGNEEAPPPAPPPPPEVTVVTLQPQTVTLTRELPGRTSPFLVAEVRPQVGGIIEKRLFTEGGRVKAGQPLYQLDDDILRADQASARASLGRAQATLNAARLTAKRTSELAKIDAVSKQDNENAIAALRQAEADVAAARATLERVTVTLGYSKITAPISGQIGKSSVTQGALVTANQPTALTTIQQLDPIYVEVTQSSAELLALRRQLAAGQLKPAENVPVMVVLEDGRPYSHEGKLTFTGVTVDPGTGSYLLRITVPNPDEILLPGMYVRAVISTGVRPDALLVPQPAVARDPKGGTSVMLVGADGKVEVRPIQVSRTIGDKWLVESGLAPGDKVIVEGLQKIRPGIPVRATEAPTAPAGGPSSAGAGQGGAPVAGTAAGAGGAPGAGTAARAGAAPGAGTAAGTGDAPGSGPAASASGAPGAPAGATSSGATTASGTIATPNAKPPATGSPGASASGSAAGAKPPSPSPATGSGAGKS